MSSIYQKLRVARDAALKTCRDPGLVEAVCNSLGSVRGSVDDVKEGNESKLLATLNRMARGTKAPVAFASIQRGKGRVYVNDETVDDEDVEYVAERIANPNPNAKAKRLPTMEELTKAAYAKWNRPVKQDDE
jgi:hypothetical protein